MKNDILIGLRGLSDAALVAGLQCSLTREREDTASVVAHLAELDTRDMHIREGYPSLFVYCRDALGLSEGEAYNRIEVARAARRFPVVLEMLADGRVHLTAVRILAPHLTAENHTDVLGSARGKTKIEIQEIVARLAPQPDVPASVRRVPASRPKASPPAAAPDVTASPMSPPLVLPPETLPPETLPPVVLPPVTLPAVVLPAVVLPAVVLPALVSPPPVSAPVTTARPADCAATAEPSPTREPALAATIAPAAVPRAAITPLSPERYKLQVTISGETLEKIRLAKDTLSHAIPTGDDAAILGRAFDALLEKLAKQKFAATDKPRGSPGPKVAGQDLTAAVMRAVWVRDLGRCRYIGPSGHRCEERRFVEFHHTDPRALGGEASVDLIELRCRRHNDYEGRLYFGKRRRRTRELVPERVDLSVVRSTP